MRYAIAAFLALSISTLAFAAFDNESRPAIDNIANSQMKGALSNVPRNLKPPLKEIPKRPQNLPAFPLVEGRWIYLPDLGWVFRPTEQPPAPPALPAPKPQEEEHRRNRPWLPHPLPEGRPIHPRLPHLFDNVLPYPWY